MPYDTRYVEVFPSRSLLDSRRAGTIAALIVASLSCLRLAHSHLLWADEDYHLAAALQIVHGRVPYKDFWYDKPPLTALYYLLCGALPGWPLRLLDAAYVCSCAAVAFRIASLWWSRAEGYTAAVLFAFFTAFYLPSAVIPFAADAVMLLPHLLAILFAFERRAVWAGAVCGVAFFANTKALFVLASCCLFAWDSVLLLLLSFGIISALGLGWLAAAGAWPGYVEQVWRWGVAYAKQPPVPHLWANGLSRTANWIGFHAALALPAGWTLVRGARADRLKLAGWIMLSFAGVGLGGRFAPHYFLQLLPPLAIAAARGITLAVAFRPGLVSTGLTLLLMLPLVRFGPRYVSLATGPYPPHWVDTTMDIDSAEVAKRLRVRARPGDALLVWGYRPDIYVYTRMLSDSRFWDSQPLTGVAADRHLSDSTPIYAGPARLNRRELSRSRPQWIVDGLGLLNPALAVSQYPDLQLWFSHYRLVDRTGLSLIYERLPDEPSN